MVFTEKERIFFPAEHGVGKHTDRDEEEHQVQHERPMLEGPFGKVEPFHPDLDSKRRTFWPGMSFCTPAVTTMSPLLSPPDNMIWLGE
jgi:hypothetical protein